MQRWKLLFFIKSGRGHHTMRRSLLTKLKSNRIPHCKLFLSRLCCLFHLPLHIYDRSAIIRKIATVSVTIMSSRALDSRRLNINFSGVNPLDPSGIPTEVYLWFYFPIGGQYDFITRILYYALQKLALLASHLFKANLLSPRTFVSWTAFSIVRVLTT